MKFEEIIIGKTYWKKRVVSKRRGARQGEVEFLKVFILSKDPAKQTVLASIGGLPALIFPRSLYCRWIENKPK
jgi:hypothetical protein